MQGSLNNVRRRASGATATAVSGSAGRDNSFAVMKAAARLANVQPDKELGESAARWMVPKASG